MKLKWGIVWFMVALMAVPAFAAPQPERCGTKQPGDE